MLKEIRRKKIELENQILNYISQQSSFQKQVSGFHESKTQSNTFVKSRFHHCFYRKNVQFGIKLSNAMNENTLIEIVRNVFHNYFNYQSEFNSKIRNLFNINQK